MKNDLFKLLTFPTTADRPNELHKCIDFIESLFTDNKVYIKRYVKNNKPSIVITTKFTKKPKLMMVGHVDVVPEFSENDFIPYEKDGRIYARGASDMKGVDMAMIYAMKELIAADPDIDIGLMITTDEEIGGMNGAGYLVNEEEIAPELVFLPDGGDSWGICTDEKGIWHVKVTMQGKASHGSRPWLGENAIEKAVACYAAIKAEFEAKWGATTEDDRWKPTVNLGVLNGGLNTNSVPDSAEMKLDIRYTHEQSTDEIREILEAKVAEFGGKFETIAEGSNSHTDENHPALKLWEKLLIENGACERVQYVKTHGASDNRFFSAKGIPGLISKPLCSEPHIKDEWIDYDSLVKFKDVLVMWVKGVM